MADTVQIELVQGEDFAAQMFWTSEYNDPIPISDPALLDVKDGAGQVALRFTSEADADTEPRLTLNAYSGFIQITVPSTVTRDLDPGCYVFDLFASVADSSAPFTRQAQQVCTGYFVVLPRTSKMEQAPELLTAQVEAP